MKKYIVIFAIMLMGVSAFAQRGIIQTIATDNMEGNNSAVLATIPVTGTYESLFVKIAATRVSTAAGGVFYLYAGLDVASKQAVTSLNSTVEFMVNDTMTTTDVATQYFNINIPSPGAAKYFIFGDGDVNDTVSVVTQIMLK